MIYLDFDRTLFDTAAFLKELEKILNNYHISKDQFQKYKEQYQDEGFNPYSILRRMESEINFNREIYNKIDELIMNDYVYVYNDAEYFLTKVKEMGYHLTLLTKGNLRFQIKKINNARILDYFDDIIVTLNHKGEMNLNYHEGIFIDDNPLELLSIVGKHPKKVIRIKRNNTLYNKKMVNDEIIECSSLSEIIDKNLLEN